MEEVQECIKNFIFEKTQMQNQITEIEQKRTQLAKERNEKKKSDKYNTEVDKLGRQISELGNQSQELQNKLDFKFNEIKTQTNFRIDNYVVEGIRKIRKINEEIQDLQHKIEIQEERNSKYQLQKQEFYVRFGRMPELSENAKKEHKIQEEISTKNVLEVEDLNAHVKEIQEQITELVKVKKAVKNRELNYILDNKNEAEIEEISIEPLIIEEMEQVEEIFVEEFGNVEEIYIEEFKPIEELYIEDFEPISLNQEIEELENKTENTTVDEIEELAKAIVEEIVSEQTKDININKIEEDEVEDIITFEEKEEKKENVIIPLFGQRVTISSIIVKIEEKQLVYKAQMSDGEEIKIYPSQLGTENVLLRDKKNREECKEILINYAISEYKALDKKVIAKIDPLVCELLIVCAEKYKLNAQELIYNYAMSFSKSEEIELETVPGVIYNLSYIEDSELTRKEKAVINKICKNAKKNIRIDIIESFTGFKKIKYILKRIFAVNNVKVLPEAKY